MPGRFPFAPPSSAERHGGESTPIGAERRLRRGFAGRFGPGHPFALRCRTPLAVLGLLLAGFCGWNWPLARSIESAIGPVPPEIQEGVYWSIDVSGGTTTIELPEPAAACELIVSSLGDPGRTYRVQLAAAASSEVARGRLRAVNDLPGPARIVARASCLAHEEHQHLAPHGLPNPGCGERECERAFHLHVADLPLEDPRGYARIDATLAGEGRDVRVFLDRQLTPAGLARGLVDAIIERLDEGIIPRSRSFLGVHRDVDGDGKLAVLLTPWLGRLQGGTTSVRGFVRSSDFQPDGEAPFGIHSDVIYLNSGLHPDAALGALLAHEYTHAVCCSLRLAPNDDCPAPPHEEDWLNEAIAHVAEQQHGVGWSNLDRRVRSYLEAPEQAPLVVADYYRAGLWRNDACRGATFLFLQWCVDTFGPRLLPELASHPATGALKLEAVTGHSFGTLYRRWTIAVHRGRLDSVDLRGPLGECRLQGPALRHWKAEDGPRELELRGTTTAFVRIEPQAGATARRVSVKAPPGARLQVTLVRMR